MTYLNFNIYYGKSLLGCLLCAVLISRTIAPYYGWEHSQGTFNSSLKTVYINGNTKYDVWPVITAVINLTYTDRDGYQTVVTAEEVGRFGTGLIGNFQGSVSTSVPIDGCTQLQNVVNDYPWVAFVKRGGCTFSIKARLAVKAGASGMIVYSYREEPLITMDIEESSLPAAMIPREYASNITMAIEDGYDVMIGVTVGRNLTSNDVRSAASISKSRTMFLLLISTLMAHVSYI